MRVIKGGRILYYNTGLLGGMYMKKIVIFLSVTIVIFLTACGGGYVRYKNHKADDVISKAIYEEFGDDIYYQGKRDSSNVDLLYMYLLRTEDAELMLKLVSTVNEVIEQEDITDKVEICCYAEIPGGWATIVIFSNFSNEKLESADYQGLQGMTLVGDKHSLAGAREDYFYDNPSLYTNIPNIRSLVTYEKIQGKAEAQGIDWYECWPELETFEVYTREN